MQGHSPELVSLRADPCIARFSARFSILCCENQFTLKTHRRTHSDANQRIDPHRTSIRYYGNEIAGGSEDEEGRNGGGDPRHSDGNLYEGVIKPANPQSSP